MTAGILLIVREKDEAHVYGEGTLFTSAYCTPGLTIGVNQYAGLFDNDW